MKRSKEKRRKGLTAERERECERERERERRGKGVRYVLLHNACVKLGVDRTLMLEFYAESSFILQSDVLCNLFDSALANLLRTNT
jgi:predicted solute-binding protein